MARRGRSGFVMEEGAVVCGAVVCGLMAVEDDIGSETRSQSAGAAYAEDDGGRRVAREGRDDGKIDGPSRTWWRGGMPDGTVAGGRAGRRSGGSVRRCAAEGRWVCFPKPSLVRKCRRLWELALGWRAWELGPAIAPAMTPG